MTIPTFRQIWANYLFDSEEAPKGDALLSDNIIRDNGLIVKEKSAASVIQGRTVEISAVEDGI